MVINKYFAKHLISLILIFPFQVHSAAYDPDVNEHKLLELIVHISRLSGLRESLLRGNYVGSEGDGELRLMTSNMDKKKSYSASCSNHESVLILNSSMNLSDIRWNDFDVFCFLPGDYKNQIIKIKGISGVEGNPKKIIGLNFGDLQTDTRKESRKKGAVIVGGLEIASSGYWEILGITILNPQNSNFVNNSRNIVLDSLVIIDANPTNVKLLLIFGKSENITIKNSFIKKQYGGYKTDVACIELLTHNKGTVEYELKNTKILNNTIVNCNDGIQLVVTGAAMKNPGFYSGTVIADNDIFIENTLYSNGDGKFDFENGVPDGAYACAENAIDIKSATSIDNMYDFDNWVKIINNRISGYRVTDSTKALSGHNNEKRLCSSGSHGAAIVTHLFSSGVFVYGNIIKDSSRGIVSSGGELGRGFNIIANNKIQDIHDCRSLSRNAQSKRCFYSSEDKGIGIVVSKKMESNIIAGNLLENIGYRWLVGESTRDKIFCNKVNRKVVAVKGFRKKAQTNQNFKHKAGIQKRDCLEQILFYTTIN